MPALPVARVNRYPSVTAARHEESRLVRVLPVLLTWFLFNQLLE